MNNLKSTILQFSKKYAKAWKDAGLKFESEKVQFAAQAELEDGTQVYTSADSWAEGVDIFTLDESGEVATPLADGEYLLKDGTKLMVESGLVVTVTVAEVEANALSSEDVAAILEKLESRINEVEQSKTKITDLETKLASITTERDAQSVELAKLRKAPAATSVRHTSTKTVDKPKALTAGELKAMSTAERITYHREQRLSN